ncbi:MAG: hypothetical protein JWN32_1867 [Solirubrobacterales bacterium]|nr:hypothetical protein [Solirubrobacterales bacterium]
MTERERFDVLLQAHEAQTRHLAAERAKVAEMLDELQTALDRERARIDELSTVVERLEREKAHLQHLYDGVLQMRVVRWSAPLRRLRHRS